MGEEQMAATLRGLANNIAELLKEAKARADTICFRAEEPKAEVAKTADGSQEELHEILMDIEYQSRDLVDHICHIADNM